MTLQDFIRSYFGEHRYTQGSTPRPDTLRKLSRAIGMPLSQLLEAAGYADPQELQAEVQSSLTRDEEELLAEGLRSLAMAQHLVIFQKATETHVSRIMAKPGAKARIEAVCMATEKKLIN